MSSVWTYQGEVFVPPTDIVGFVYNITDLSNDKMYIGKKLAWSKRKLPPLKGQKRKRTVIVESDWKTYFGSSELVKSLVEEHGTENFTREVLHLCYSKGVMNYLEMKEQVDRNVLLSDKYYNKLISVKIHASHIAVLKEE